MKITHVDYSFSTYAKFSEKLTFPGRSRIEIPLILLLVRKLELYKKMAGSLGIQNILILLLRSVKLYNPMEYPITSEKMILTTFRSSFGSKFLKEM